MKMTKYYFFALTCSFALVWLSISTWYLIPSIWLSISLLCVFIAYASNSPSLFRKSTTGAIPLWIKLLLLPYLLGAQVYNAIVRHNDKVPAIQQITPNLFLACRLFPSDVEALEAQGVTAILDVTAEFDGLNWSAEQEHLHYLNIPVLDHYSPNETQLQHAINWIKVQHQLNNKVVIHCALGRGRSFFMLCAYLLASEPCKSEREIIEKVQSIRTTARLNKKQLKRLLSLSKYIKEHRPQTLSLIINPVSGGGKWAYYGNHVLGILTQHYALNCYFTEENTNACDLVQSIAPDSPHTFVACGGDGTVAQVAAAIKNTQHTLAILPMGTANAMAHVLFGLTSKVDPFNCACNALIEHNAAPMDTLECNGKTALLVVALGIEEKMISHADRNLKNQHGQLAYIQGFMEALLDSNPLDIQMCVDNQEVQHISSSSLAIANAAPVTTILAQGGGAPNWQDGLFDITMLKYHNDTSKKLLSLAELLSSTLSHQPEQFNINHVQGKSVEIIASEPFHYCIDGEIDQANKLNIEIRSQSLSVIVPN